MGVKLSKLRNWWRMTDALWKIERAHKKGNDFYNIEIVEENLKYEEAIDRFKTLNYNKEGYVAYRMLRVE